MIATALSCPLLLLLLGLAATVLPRPAARPLVYGIAALLSALLFVLGLVAIAATPSGLALPLGPPGFACRFRLDSLTGAFLCLINLGGFAASLYGIGYGRHAEAPRRVLPFFPAFLAAMNLVVLADDAYSFLFAWELMSLFSWALVMSDHRAPETAPAGFLYLVMASGGTLALLLGFGLLTAAAGGTSFAAIMAHPPSPAVATVVLLLVLVGTGSKAGLLPLHAWLPLAHPAAPSHVSALMSGVMTKVAIYAFLRIAFTLLGPPAWWWGVPALLLGGITAVMGMLYALLETDLKRILAYSTIENIGIVFAALGLALAFLANAQPGAAALALTAGLFHAFNHMLCKTTLFFGAGNLTLATGTRDIERLGGLLHRMPRTGLAFLGASLAIAALPPSGGFVSEWLVFQSILISPHLEGMGLKLLVPAIGVLLALAAALAAACFLRAFGIPFLGRPRSDAAAQARETSLWCSGPMLAGAALCFATGLFPGTLIDALRPVTTLLTAGRMPLQGGGILFSITPISASRSSYNGLVIAIFLVASATLAAWAVHRFGSRLLRRAPAWGCGAPPSGPETQYSATSLSQPLRRVFATLPFAASSDVLWPPPGDPSPAHLRNTQRDPFWVFLYAPIGWAVRATATQLNRLQFLTIRSYLSLVFATLVLLLTVLAVRG